jgi:predicted lysophospholipase L1 biosynthesis ABC-type transport system permease subunit
LTASRASFTRTLLTEGNSLAASRRIVEWRNLGINFVMVFSPGTFRGAPHSDLATLTLPEHVDRDGVADLEVQAAGELLVEGDEGLAGRLALPLRHVEWRNLGINFVMVFSPGTFRGAPHSDLATLTR